MGIIIKPLVTEKNDCNYREVKIDSALFVRPEANKLEIKSEIEALYNVTVVDVNNAKIRGQRVKPLYKKSGHQWSYECL